MTWFNLLKYDVLVDKPLPLVTLASENSDCCDVAFEELEEYLNDVLGNNKMTGYSQYGITVALERLKKKKTRKDKCRYVHKYLSERSIEGTGSGLLNLKTKKILDDWDSCERKNWKEIDANPKGYGTMEEFRGRYE